VVTAGPVRQFPLAFISRQFVLASAPMIPQAVQTMRGPEGADEHLVATTIGRQDDLVVTQLACDRERTHAQLAHVAEGHWRAGSVTYCSKDC
jgi:hypothetical protein